MTDALTDALKPEPQDDNVDYLETLVGEGKKYKTVKDLAKSYIHADKHIRELTEELDELRDTKSTMDEVLAELRKTAKPNGNDPAPGTEPPVAPNEGEKDVTKIVQETVTNVLTAREREALAKANTEKLLNKLVQEYGSKEAAGKAVNSYHQGKDYLIKFINELGNTDPDEAFNTITARVPKPTIVPNTPGISGKPSADALIASVSGLTYSQVRKIRKEQPEVYKSKAFQDKLVAIVAQYTAQGKDFFAT